MRLPGGEEEGDYHDGDGDSDGDASPSMVTVKIIVPKMIIPEKGWDGSNDQQFWKKQGSMIENPHKCHLCHYLDVDN